MRNQIDRVRSQGGAIAVLILFALGLAAVGLGIYTAFVVAGMASTFVGGGVVGFVAAVAVFFICAGALVSASVWITIIVTGIISAIISGIASLFSR